MDIKEIYNQLTNVDIEQQKQIWDERGKGYYGEYLLFCELYKSIAGNGKILMNLNVPVNESKTTEIDLILIHETGLYVFEIKHYKGTIYGKNTDATWTQYFRTVKNNTFRNPIEQNKYHIDALKGMFPNIPIHSCIVFTSDDCDIRVSNLDKNIDICQLYNVSRTLSDRFSRSINRFSMEDIDIIFSQLYVYSQMKEKVIINNIEADFFSWVQPVVNELENKKAEVENKKAEVEKEKMILIRSVEQEKQNLIRNTEKLNKTKIKGIIANIGVAIVCVIVSIFVTFNVIQKNNNELNVFKQNFLHIDEIGNEYIDALNSYVDVSNVLLSPLSDDAVSFTARIAMANDTYGIALTANSKYIVMTNSGQVFEYNVFGEHLAYNAFSNRIGTGIQEYGDLAKAQFFGISNINDITYIKLTGIEMFKLNVSRTVIKDALEIELYSK